MTAELRQSENQLRDFFDNANDLIQSVSPDGRFIFVNLAWRKTLGYSESEIKLLSLLDILHPNSREHCMEALKSVQAGERRDKLEVTFVTKDSRAITVEGSVNCRFEDGSPKENRGIFRDITERKRAESELREMSAALENAVDGISRVDTQGRYIAVNKAYASMVGYKPEELVGMEWQPTVHSEDREHMIAAYQDMLTNGKVEAEARGVRKDGSIFYKQLVMVSAYNQQRQFIGHYCFMKDITERKKVEETLRQANEERRQAQEMLQRQFHRTLLLKQITAEIRQSLDTQQIFQTAATQIGQAFQVNRCVIQTYITKPTVQVPFVAEYLEPGYESILDLEIPVIGNPHVEQLLAQEQAIASFDVYTEPLLQAAATVCRQIGLKSMLTIRTSYQSKPNGVITLHQCDSFRNWSEDEIELLEAVAAQVGIALAQAHLLEQEKQQSEELTSKNFARLASQTRGRSC